MDCFISNVLTVMRKKGISQIELARRVGTSQPGISRILNHRERISIDRAERIADALGVKLSKLFEISRNSA